MGVKTGGGEGGEIAVRVLYMIEGLQYISTTTIKISNVTLHVEMEHFPFRIRECEGSPLLYFLLRIAQEIPEMATFEKKNKRYWNYKIKVYLFADGIALHIKISKEHTNQPLNKSIKSTINVENTVLSLCTCLLIS